MLRRAALPLLAVAMALLLAVAVPVASQEVPAHVHPTYFLDDPAADQAYDRGTLIVENVNDESFQDIDAVRLAAYEDFGVSGDAPSTFAFAIRFGANVTAGASFTVTFNVSKGPTSYADSSAGGSFTLNVTGAGATSGIDGATASATGPDLTVRIPLSALSARGGDQLTDLRIVATRADTGTLPAPLNDDQSGTDSIPDAGVTAPSFTFFRPAPAGTLRLEIVSVDGVPGLPAPRTDRDAFPIMVRVTNLGADPDRFVAALSYDAVGAGGRHQTLAADLVDPATGTLLQPGASTTRTFNLTPPALDGLSAIAVSINARSQLGGQGTLQLNLTFDLPEPAPAPPRKVNPERLGFLTPAAEAMGFDGPFDEYAEAAFLALIVLLVILALFLLLMLGRSVVLIDPASPAPAAAPRNGKAGLVEPAPTGREAAAATAAALPDDAPSPLRTAAAAPVPAVPAPAAAAAAPLAMAIESVVHEPSEPTEGEEVETTVTLRGGPSSTPVRVVLTVDGVELADAEAVVPARATKAVRLQWPAGAGDNRVRVRVVPR